MFSIKRQALMGNPDDKQLCRQRAACVKAYVTEVVGLSELQSTSNNESHGSRFEVGKRQD